MATEKSRETTLRHKARRLGMTLRKDRARSVSINHCGGYMLIDASGNYLVAGEQFELSLDQVAERLDAEERQLAESRAVS